MPQDNTVLLARITLKDVFGNLSRMDVRRGQNCELVLHLGGSGGAESLGNMIGRDASFPPAFCSGDDDAATVDSVEVWIAGSRRKIVRTERGPSATREG